MSHHPLDLLQTLRKAAHQLEFTLLQSGATDGGASYSPWLEAERREEVDETCARLAQRMAGARARPDSSLIPEMDAPLGMLVLQRLRDAQRFLQEQRSRASRKPKEEKLAYHSLLVESWHSYAERFWLERVSRFDHRRDARN